MLKNLISQYGKEKINTFTKYPSILTLHQLGEKGKLKTELTTPIENEKLVATEKIDGTNVRIICYGNEFLIGSREFILHHSDDLYFDPSTGIVEGIKEHCKDLLGNVSTNEFTVIYGEFFGGKITVNSSYYGKEKTGFRVFDVAVYKDLAILETSIREISHWREHETENGLEYGQSFLTRQEMIKQFPDFDFVPEIEFELNDVGHTAVLENLRKTISFTKVALSETASKKAEGLILRNENRTKIVKLRFEDYERTLK